MERRLGNPVGGRLDYAPVNLRDRNDQHYRHYTGVTSVDPWTKESGTATTTTTTGAVTEKPEFSDSLFAVDSSVSGSGSITRRQSDASKGSSINRLSDASKSSYQPFPQQEVDQRLQPSRPSPSQELGLIPESQQQEQQQRSSPDNEEKKKSAPQSSTTTSLSQAASEDLTAATSLKNLQQQGSGQQSEGFKRKSSWLQQSGEMKEDVMNKS